MAETCDAQDDKVQILKQACAAGGKNIAVSAACERDLQYKHKMQLRNE